MAGNTSTKKAYAGMQPMPVTKALPSKTATMGVHPGKYAGQLKESGQETFGNPMNMGAPAHIVGLAGTYNDIGEMSGFITEGYLDKNGTPYGEGAKLNYLPPGMDIDNQMMLEVHTMSLRTYGGGVSYPDDGWMPKPRDVKE